MNIDDFIWLDTIVEKIEIKHGVRPEEAEEIFFNRPRFRFVEEGHRKGDNVYSAAGQTDAGRYLIVFFILKKPNSALVLSAVTWTLKSVGDMGANKGQKLSTISKAASYEAIGEYWDEHSLDEIWDETREVHFDVRAKRRHRVVVDPEIYERLEAEARVRGVVPETLINLWLSERLDAAK